MTGMGTAEMSRPSLELQRAGHYARINQLVVGVVRLGDAWRLDIVSTTRSSDTSLTPEPCSIGRLLRLALCSSLQDLTRTTLMPKLWR